MVVHRGGCHCKAVRFEVEAPAALVVWDCNCSICTMKRNTHFVVPCQDFRLASEAGKSLSVYTFNTGNAQHKFCKKCGICSFYIPRSNPDGIAVTIHCLDPGTVSSIEMRKFDGDKWEAFIAKSGITELSEAKI